MMQITRNDIMGYGFVMLVQFDELYPSGTTIKQMRIDSESHGWIRAILPGLEKTKEYASMIDFSEVSM